MLQVMYLKKLRFIKAFKLFACFRVKLDSVTGGFVFVRWDKQKKQHYVANKMIDPGVYYNLKSAPKKLCVNNPNASFSVEDDSTS